MAHIRELSDSRLSHANALKAFAHCFHTVYGECSFISLERDDELAPGCRVRMIFRAGGGVDDQIESHLDDELFLDIPQAHDLMHTDQAQVVENIDPSLQVELRRNRLPAESMMTLPLFLDGGIHRWVFVLGDRPGQFSQVDLEQAMLLANLANTYMARIDDTKALARANAWIERELHDIGRLHRLLLPQEEVQIRGAESSSYVSFCEVAGGDYFDLVNLSRLLEPDYPGEGLDRWGLIIADASGHGAAAAVEIAMFDAVLRTYHAVPENGPANVFNYTNRYFFTRTLRGSFITAAILSYDPKNRLLRYANAGHPPVILKTPEGELLELSHNSGIPLGVDPGWEWQNTEIEIAPGSVLVSYTDGMTEALSPEGKQFGSERFKEMIAKTIGTAKDYRHALVQAVQEHQQGAQQADDQALVVMHITQ